jgi:phosphate transport system substrate-binding protein
VLAFFVAILAGISGGAASAEPIRGAGSTFAYPVIAKWSAFLAHAARDEIER